MRHEGSHRGGRLESKAEVSPEEHLRQTIESIASGFDLRDAKERGQALDLLFDLRRGYREFVRTFDAPTSISEWLRYAKADAKKASGKKREAYEVLADSLGELLDEAKRAQIEAIKKLRQFDETVLDTLSGDIRDGWLEQMKGFSEEVNVDWSNPDDSYLQEWFERNSRD